MTVGNEEYHAAVTVDLLYFHLPKLNLFFSFCARAIDGLNMYERQKIEVKQN